MKFTDYLNEHGIFYGFTSMCDELKIRMLAKDLSVLGIPHEIVPGNFDEMIPQECKITVHIPCLDNMDTESQLRDVKRRLLTAGWADLALENEHMLFKRSVYIQIIKGFTGNILICIK